MKRQGASVACKKSKSPPPERPMTLADVLNPVDVDDDCGLSAHFLEAEAKWPPGHPERVKAAFDEFKGKFEPEFWDTVLSARHLGRQRPRKK